MHNLQRTQQQDEFILKEYESLRTNILQNYNNRNSAYTAALAFLSLVIYSSIPILVSETDVVKLQPIYYAFVVLIPIISQLTIAFAFSQEISTLEIAHYIKKDIEKLIFPCDTQRRWETTKVDERDQDINTILCIELNHKTPLPGIFRITLSPTYGIAIQLPLIFLLINFLLWFYVRNNIGVHDYKNALPLCWGTCVIFTCTIWTAQLIFSYLHECNKKCQEKSPTDPSKPVSGDRVNSPTN